MSAPLQNTFFKTNITGNLDIAGNISVNSQNVYLGYLAGSTNVANVDNMKNVAIGSSCATYQTGSNNVSIGYDAAYNSTTTYTDKNNVSIVMEQTDENYKNVYYDFMTSDLTTYEVKADEMSLNTNNFFIEFKKGNTRTGILTSDATFHSITNTKKYYLIETAALRKLVFQNRIKYKQGKTKDNTVGFLVPTCDIIEIYLKLYNSI
jgi:hypothetical protein